MSNMRCLVDLSHLQSLHILLDSTCRSKLGDMEGRVIQTRDEILVKDDVSNI